MASRETLVQLTTREFVLGTLAPQVPSVIRVVLLVRVAHSCSLAASSKDVILIVDISKSTAFKDRLEIAKAATKAVLRTLNGRDFVQVIVFSTEARMLEPCLGKKLVRATDAIKQRFSELIDALEPDDRTDYVTILAKHM
jgi:Mg-chelatase subunit ChlD